MYDPNVIAGMLVGGTAVAVGIVSFVLYVLVIIGDWKIFTKAGEPGWKSLIPFYNLYIQVKLTWKTEMFWAFMAVLVVGELLMRTNSQALQLIGDVLLIAALVLDIMIMNQLSKSFGHGKGFTVGLVFLPSIFLIILGFGESKYIGNLSQTAQQ